MDVVFWVVWQVVVEHVADIGDVQAARSDVGGDKDGERAVVERAEHLQALVLRHIAAHRFGVKPVRLQAALQHFGGALHVHEDDGALGHVLAQQADQEAGLLFHGWVVDDLTDTVRGDLLRLDTHQLRVVHVLVGQFQHALRERGGEQHGQARLGRR